MARQSKCDRDRLFEEGLRSLRAKFTGISLVAIKENDSDRRYFQQKTERTRHIAPIKAARQRCTSCGSLSPLSRLRTVATVAVSTTTDSHGAGLDSLLASWLDEL